MKTIMKFWIGMLVIGIHAQASYGQTVDEERMKQDIEVAENVLATLIKREIGQQRTFFGLDVRGFYQPGYGVTFRVPSSHSMPFGFTISGDDVHGATVISDGMNYRYSITTNGSSKGKLAEADSYKLKDKSKEKIQSGADSVRVAYNENVIKAAQNFILDYSDFISQLAPNEKIVVTNQSERPHFVFNTPKRTHISVEGVRSDITAFRQGKVTRDQAMKKISVVNTESVEAREQDMEMLASIFSRLYRPDLSKTYFVEGNVYYERLKDFGAIFYMQMLSSSENFDRFTIPTLGLEGLDQDARDKKVAELYPAFEEDLKENILEYGRTIKSLKDEETLIFNISLTKCAGCGIPSTLEVNIPGKVLKDYGNGMITKSEAVQKFTLKKGAKQ
jgi:hypothetical protein